MAVFKRKTSRGFSKYYNYRFKLDGKIYYGPCYLESPDGEKLKCTTKEDALKAEKKAKDFALNLRKHKTEKGLLEEYRETLTGGTSISLDEAFEFSLKKPRKRQPAERQLKTKRSYWKDFVCFIEGEYPELETISDIRKKQAEEYIHYLRTKGRYNNKIQFKRDNKVSEYETSHNLSNKSCNARHIAISEVFKLLVDDAGLISNPFENIQKLQNKSETREAFTEEELKDIAANADPFIYSLFAIGMTTALREGDICTLKWEEVNLARNLITRRMRKTGKFVEIPILPPLKKLLLKLKKEADGSEYVLPKHAEMYESNHDSISYRVRTFLESLDVKTTKKVPGRSREISVKDVHSLRHTFCYFAGVYGIPFLIVKDICGHVNEKMTELYQKHASVSMKREKLQQMPDFMGLLPENKQIEEVTIEEKIEKIESILEGKRRLSESDRSILEVINL